MKIHSTLLIAMSLVMMGCQEKTDVSTPAPTSDTAAPKIESANTATATSESAEQYVVGIDVGSPPFSTSDEKGIASGFEVEILQAIAKDQAFAVTFLGQQRADLYKEMEAGKYQVMAASLEINPDNQAKFDMTNPHAKSYRAILSRGDKKAESPADLMKGDLVGVQASTASSKLLKDGGANIQEFSNLFSNFQAFMKQETAFLVGNAVPLSYYLKQYGDNEAIKDVHMTAYDNPVKINEIAFAVPKGNTELKDKINTGLANIQNDGTYDTIYQKWFGEDDIAKVEIKK